MPCILLVDDSPVDRRLVGGLFEKELDWIVDYAPSGVQALETMELTLPDLVVTDLMMPEMDGLELVQQVRKKYPAVPVILITAHGSEALAVEALEVGASSYVPKSQLAAKLMDTARQVLSISQTDQTYARLLNCTEEIQARFLLPNDAELIPRFVEDVVVRLEAMECCDETETRHLAVALEEALFNAMLHGNLALTRNDAQEAKSHLLRSGESPIIQDRLKDSKFSSRVITAGYRINKRESVIVIRDQGDGFDADDVPKSGDPEPIEAESGRGLVLIKNFMDEVTFNATGNEIKMVKRWD